MIGKPSDLDGSTRRVCPGKSGLVVLISEDDLREIVSVGRNRAAAAREPASEVWFGPFNSTAHTVEWRAVDNKPFAIIQRWLIADNSDPDKNARRDEIAAGAGLPRRLCRRPGQPQPQRTRPQGRGRIRARFQVRQGRSESDWRARPRGGNGEAVIRPVPGSFLPH